MIQDKKIHKDARVAQRNITLPMDTIVVSKTGRPFHLLRLGHSVQLVSLNLFSLALTGAVSIDIRKLNQLNDLITTPGLAMSAGTKDEVSFNAFVARANGVFVEKAADTDCPASAAHVVTATKWGVVLYEMNSSGAVATVVPAATPTTAMAYDTAGEAEAALPANTATKTPIGYLIIQAGAGDFTFNTTEFDAAGVDATFADFPIATSFLDAAIAFVTGKTIPGVLAAAVADVRAQSTQDIGFFYTSDGTGALVNGTVDARFRTWPISNEAGTRFPGNL